DKTVRLWDVVSGKAVADLKGHTRPVRCLAFSPDSRTLASGGFDGLIRLWDIGAGKELAVLKGHAGGVMSVKFSPDGRLLASGSGAEVTPGQGKPEVKLWELKRTAPSGLPGSKEAGATGGTPKPVGDRLDQLLKELLGSKRSDEQVLEALCLATLGRLP